MADDQVKYSELVRNDNNSFQGLLDALEAIKVKIRELKEEGARMRITVRNNTTATREQQQATADNAAQAERLRASLHQLTEEEARLKAAIAEANRMAKLQGQYQTAASGSLNEMRARYKLLVAEMGNYNLKTAEGQRKMRTTAAEARKLRDEIYKLESAYGQFGRNVGNYTGALSRFGARLKEAAARFVAFNAAFLSFTGAIRFGKALFEVRKELESTLVTYKALAGEIQGAKLFEEVKNFALSTPVTLNAASKAVQTMLSFGVAQEKVVDIMKRLGDISSADSERMQRLALAYSQATQAGRLMGQDTLQFINAGFNPLYYISLRTGESMEYLRDQMKKGKIDISQVTQAIIDATSEGGQFNGMLEKQRDTMKGAAAIMEGAWQNMLNEMGADMEGGIVGIIKWLTKLMQNWRETMRTMREWAVSIGVAKVALVAYDFIIQKTTADTVANTAATKAATVATKGFAATLGRVGIFAAVMGITLLVQKLIDVATASERAAKEIKRFEEDAAQGVSGTVSQYQQLAKEWQRLGNSQSERATWIKEHKRLFDELGLSIKDANEADRAFSEEGTRAYIDAVKRRAIADAYKERLARVAIRENDALDRMHSMEEAGTATTIVRTPSPTGRTIYNARTGTYTTTEPDVEHTVQTRGYAAAVKEYNEAQAERLEIEKKIAEFEEGALDKAPGGGFQPVTTGGGDGGGGKIKGTVSGYSNTYKGVTAADVLVAEAQAMKDKGDDALAEIQLWYDKKVAIANASYAKEMENLEKGREDKNKSLTKSVQDAQIFLSKYNKSLEKLNEVKDEEEREALRKKLEEGYKQATAVVESESVERQRIKDYYDQMEIVAEEKKQNELLDLQKQYNDKLFKEEERRFKAKQDAEKRRFDLEKHNSIERAKFDMEQEKASKQWQINHAKELELSEEELAILKEEVEWLEKKYNKGLYNAKRGNTGNYSNIMDVLFGESMTKDQQSALTAVFDQAKEALNSWMDARKAAADQAKELADDEVSAAENALNREIELRNQGYANDVALRERELADAKEKQRQAAEEQNKIAKEQILLDAAMQTSSMITASANIIKQFPNPLAWVPMLATMWGAFAYAKVQAYKASEKSIKFRKGGVMLLEGGSHESGHDISLGVGPDGSNLRAEGGEYFAVINKRSSRRYGSEIPAVVNALNSGVFEERYIKTRDAMGLLPQVVKADDGSMVDLGNVEAGVSALVKQGERTYSVEGDYRVMRYKNLTRRVRISR